MAIGSGRPMEDAARIAYRELIRWLVAGLWLGARTRPISS